MALAKTIVLQNDTLCDKMPKGHLCLPRADQNLSYDSDSWQWSFKIEFFPFQKDIPIYSPVSYHRRAVGSIGKGW